jgi:hypothetical protein
VCAYLREEHDIGRPPECSFGLGPPIWESVLKDDEFEDGDEYAKEHSHTQHDQHSDNSIHTQCLKIDRRGGEIEDGNS